MAGLSFSWEKYGWNRRLLKEHIHQWTTRGLLGMHLIIFIFSICSFSVLYHQSNIFLINFHWCLDSAGMSEAAICCVKIRHYNIQQVTVREACRKWFWVRFCRWRCWWWLKQVTLRIDHSKTITMVLFFFFRLRVRCVWLKIMMPKRRRENEIFLLPMDCL